MADDIRQFVKNVKNCETCQRVNDAKFIMVDAALHPILAKSQVWNQVHCICTRPHICLTFSFFFCIMTGMSMVMVKWLRFGHKHQALSGVLGFIIVYLII